MAVTPFHRLNSVLKGKTPDKSSEYIWALRDVSFDISEGETVGIIGLNGAGKSTLLKVLTRITQPTKGFADVKGRVGSLLEVGTGFHPELTGRENIFLNGSILGMTRLEVEQQFDEIVEFAEVEKFLDTPVKRYSSGMYVRLAFGVASHLQSEILLVDEVLAVGDKSFQDKCLQKMGIISEEGRTVLLVSHNMGAIKSLCKRALLIDSGRLIMDGKPDEVVSAYLEGLPISKGTTLTESEARVSGAKIETIKLLSEDGTPKDNFLMTEPIIVETKISVSKNGNYTLSVQIKERTNSPISHFPSGDSNLTISSQPGSYTIRTEIPPLNLYPGKYLFRLALTNIDTDEQQEVDGLGVDIEQDYNLCSRPLPRQAGLIYAIARWDITDY
jgi:lipopolysaccharide transport system ATP-binding protein